MHLCVAQYGLMSPSIIDMAANCVKGYNICLRGNWCPDNGHLGSVALVRSRLVGQGLEQNALWVSHCLFPLKTNKGWPKVCPLQQTIECLSLNQVWAACYRADLRLATSQWEPPLQSNAISHWLGTNYVGVPCCMQYHVTQEWYIKGL